MLNIFLCSDKVFFVGLLATACSIVASEKKSVLKLNILDGGITDKQWECFKKKVLEINPKVKIERHNANIKLISKFSNIRELTYLTYARLLVPKLANSQYAIYVDSDFICTKSLSTVIDILPENKTIYGVSDLEGQLSRDCPWGKGLDLSKYNYINCGFIVINVTRWNQNNYTDKIFKFLKDESHNCAYGDQSAINWILRGDIGELPKEWNIFSNYFDFYNGSFQPGSINIHYASGLKPWKRPLLSVSHRVWFNFAKTFFPNDFSLQSVINLKTIFRLVVRFSINKSIKSFKNLALWKKHFRSM